MLPSPAIVTFVFCDTSADVVEKSPAPATCDDEIAVEAFVPADVMTVSESSSVASVTGIEADFAFCPIVTAEPPNLATSVPTSD